MSGRYIHFQHKGAKIYALVTYADGDQPSLTVIPYQNKLDLGAYIRFARSGNHWQCLDDLPERYPDTYDSLCSELEKL